MATSDTSPSLHTSTSSLPDNPSSSTMALVSGAPSMSNPISSSNTSSLVDTSASLEPHTPSSTAATFDSFTWFPKVPIELRLAIWKLAANVPRNVEVRIKSKYSLSEIIDRPWTDGRPPLYCHSRSRPPAMLSASPESRAEGLKFYSLEFGRRPATSRIYVNWDTDRLCISQQLLGDFYQRWDVKTHILSQIAERCRDKNVRRLGLIGPHGKNWHDVLSVYLLEFHFVDDFVFCFEEIPNRVFEDHYGFDLVQPMASSSRPGPILSFLQTAAQSRRKGWTRLSKYQTTLPAVTAVEIQIAQGS